MNSVHSVFMWTGLTRVNFSGLFSSTAVSIGFMVPDSCLCLGLGFCLFSVWFNTVSGLLSLLFSIPIPDLEFGQPHVFTLSDLHPQFLSLCSVISMFFSGCESLHAWIQSLPLLCGSISAFHASGTRCWSHHRLKKKRRSIHRRQPPSPPPQVHFFNPSWRPLHFY